MRQRPRRFWPEGAFCHSPVSQGPELDIYENAEVLGVEVKTCSGGHVRFMSKAELQRYGDVVFVHYDWTSARRRG